MNYYPNNTVTNYITHLPRTIELYDRWEVAVVEIYYPCSFKTVNGSNVVQVEVPYNPSMAMSGTLTGEGGFNTPQLVEIKTITGELSPGSYSEVQDIIELLNKHQALAEHILFSYDPITKKVEITPKDNVIKVELPQTLALQLGFDPKEKDFKNHKKSVRPANIQLGLPSYIYIYCNIVEPQLIGDTSAPLLQIVNIDNSEYVYGTSKHVHFHSPHYVPVMKNSFESIEIDLRDDTGNNIPFEFGTSCVKLHFRKCAQ